MKLMQFPYAEAGEWTVTYVQTHDNVGNEDNLWKNSDSTIKYLKSFD